MKKNIAILGSTGSIGTQTLDIIHLNPDLFDVYLLTANNNVDLLIRQAREYRPEIVVIANDQKYHLYKRLWPICLSRYGVEPRLLPMR